MLWWAHQPPERRAIAGPFQWVVGDGRRHEAILVGTDLGNVSFVRRNVPQ